LLRSHGITRDTEEMTHVADGPWYYQQTELGFNYRMTDIQAALGLSQMKRLNEFVSKRHTIAKRYNKLLMSFPVITPWQHEDNYSGMHLYIIRINLEKIKNSHRQVFEILREGGIGVNLHYIPVYTQPYYEKIGFNKNDFPEANNYYAAAISLPMHPGLTLEEQDKVILALSKALV